MGEEAGLVSADRIQHAILELRGQRVLLDADLAVLYGVETGALNRAVRRHADRFPPDFMFRLTPEEWSILKCQSGTSRSWGGRRSPPSAFTEQGVAMLSSVLNSERAVRVNIEIMRTFVRLRQALVNHDELAHRLDELADRVDGHDQQLGAIVEAIRELMVVKESPGRRIGFREHREVED